MKHDLEAFVTHPHTLGGTSVIRKSSRSQYLQYVNTVNSLEITNSAFGSVFHLLDRPILRLLFSNKMKQMLKNRKVPKWDYPDNAKLLTAGSDAHNLGEVGTHVVIHTTQVALFAAICKNKKPLIVERQIKEIRLTLLLLSTYTCMTEALLKFKIKSTLTVYNLVVRLKKSLYKNP